jgi:redox-sensitive bicupin YhaK (pirin superfamily)
VLEITESHHAQVGEMQVRRALPRRARRTVGAWCFADHMGPLDVTDEVGADIGPHPHIGLQTVTWLTAGELLHRDSLGCEQLIRAGQLNLMTAGHGVSHAEQSTGVHSGLLAGIQLWVAQPEETRNGPAAFEHHAELPRLELQHASATVVVGELGGVTSPARADTDHLGVELALRGGSSSVPVHPHHEHALVVLDGAVTVDGCEVTPGHLAYLGTQRDELVLESHGPATVMLLGGTPMTDRLHMWWNFVARSAAEVDEASASWNADDGRFGTVDSPLARIPAPARRQ